jgi:hypothetical protein
MKWLIFALVFVLVCGALRKRFLSAWTFTFPAVIGGVCAWILFKSSFPFQVPWWAIPAAVFVAALGIGINAKLWLDGIFKRRD